MSTERTTNTQKDPDPVLCCKCGKPASEESAKCFAFLPKYWKPYCLACETEIDRQEAIHKAEIEQKRRDAERELRLAVIPPEMLRSRIDFPSFNAGLWLRVEGWRPSTGKWLGIVGGAGRSKTRCLAILCRRLILEGHRVTWTTATDFQDRVDDLRGETAKRNPALDYLRECREGAILVFDDLGKNLWTPAFERHLFGLIDYRKTHDLPTLWTANTPLREILASNVLSEERGAPLIGRLLEASTIEKA